MLWKYIYKNENSRKKSKILGNRWIRKGGQVKGLEQGTGQGAKQTETFHQKPEPESDYIVYQTCKQSGQCYPPRNIVQLMWWMKRL